VIRFVAAETELGIRPAFILAAMVVCALFGPFEIPVDQAFSWGFPARLRHPMHLKQQGNSPAW
jgi:hypothetical protein